MRRLIAAAMRDVPPAHYSAAQVEVFVGYAGREIGGLLASLDYWVLAEGGTLVASAAWQIASGDSYLGLQTPFPAGSAVFRSVYVDADWSGRGLAGQLMDHVEAQAVAAGARSGALHATLNSVSFYRRRGYAPVQDTLFHLDGAPFPGLEMAKPLPCADAACAA